MTETDSKQTAQNLITVHGLRAQAVVQERIAERAQSEATRAWNVGKMWTPRLPIAPDIRHGYLIRPPLTREESAIARGHSRCAADHQLSAR